MRRSRGFSLIELLVVIAIILVIAGIAIPSLVRARVSANEASAVSGVRTITTAQISYKISYPDVGYAANLDALGPSSNPDSTRAGLLPATIAVAPYQHNGYTFSTTGTPESFFASATPIDSGRTGIRSFCADTPALISSSQPGDTCVPGVNNIQ